MKDKHIPEQTIIEAVHGLLDGRTRIELDQHIAACPACRDRLDRLQRTVDLVRRAHPAPRLDPAKARAMRRAAADQVGRRSGRGLPGLGAWFSKPTYVAAAAACLIAVVGWWGADQLREPGPMIMTAQSSLTMPVDKVDVDLLENLEILEEMDVIKKVVQVVDHREVAL